MPKSNEIKYTAINKNLLVAGLEGYAQKPKDSTGRKYITKLDKGTTTVYFLSEETTMDQDNGWYIYREIPAWDGLRGGYVLPNNIKEFPVYDQIIEVDSEGNQQRYPAPYGTDELMPLVAPSTMFPPKDGRARAADRVAVNVVNAEGYHIILKMSGASARELFKAIDMARRMSPNFSVTAQPWELTLSGEGLSTSLTATPLIGEPLPEDLPEPHDLHEVFSDIRKQVEDFVNSINGGGQTSNQDSYEEVEEIEEAISEHPESKANRWANTSEIRMRTLLRNADVVVPPRSRKAELIALLEQHGL